MGVTTELALSFELPGDPATAFAALTNPFVLRCWYGAPPGYFRVAARGTFLPDEAVTFTLRDAWGACLTHVLDVREIGPDERVELALSWDGGPMAGEATQATLTFSATETGTRLGVGHGPFSGPEQAEAAAAFWQACGARLARLLAGGTVAPYEELVTEIQAFHDPIGVAAYGVLAALREAGAPAEAITQVEEVLYTHLPQLAPEAGDLLDTVMRERMAVLDGWRAAMKPGASTAET